MGDSENKNPVSSRADIIQQVAEALAEKRRLRGLTVDKVYSAIKIRRQYIEAIEKGEWDQLPGEVYVRGFIKRYAIYLGMDADKLLAPYIGGTSAVPESGERYNGVEKENESPNYVWIGLGLGVILLLGVFKVIRIEKASAPKSPVSAVQPVAPASTLQHEVKPVVKTEEKPSLASSASQHELQVYSVFPLWMRVSAKSKNFEGFISQSSTWSWKAEGAFSIRLGHTKQVTMFFDGRPILLQENVKKIELP